VNRKNWRRTLAVAAAVPLLALTACKGGAPAEGGAESGALNSGLGSRATDRTITFLMPQDTGDPFWGTIAQGAKDAAALYNVKLDLQTGKNDPNAYNDAIGTAVAKKPAAIAVAIDDQNRYTTNICAAKDAGIKIISYNITEPGGAADCTEAFIGQDFEATGEVVGKRLLESVKLAPGDKVFTPVELPEQVYAIQRGAGVQKAIQASGAKTDPLGTGVEDSATLDKMTSYLLSNRDVKAIVPLGGTPFRNVVKAMQDSGVKVPVVGFDLSPKVVSGIESGDISAAADQQPYVQGFQSVAQLALQLDFGLSPASMNSSGSGLVDKSSIAIVKDLAGKIR
jgi:simple sugar transport system substrate-binding protein